MSLAPPSSSSSSSELQDESSVLRRTGNAAASSTEASFDSLLSSIAAASISGPSRRLGSLSSEDGAALNSSSIFTPRSSHSGTQSPSSLFDSTTTSPSSMTSFLSSASPSPPQQQPSKILLHQDSSDPEEEESPRPSLQHRRHLKQPLPDLEGLSYSLAPWRAFTTPSKEFSNTLEIEERSPGSAATATPLASRTTFFSHDVELRRSPSPLSTLNTESTTSSLSFIHPQNLETIDLTPAASFTAEQHRSRQTTFGLSIEQDANPYLCPATKGHHSPTFSGSSLHLEPSTLFASSSLSSNAGGSTRQAIPESEQPHSTRQSANESTSNSHYLPHYSSDRCQSSHFVSASSSSSPEATPGGESLPEFKRPVFPPPQPQDSFSRSSFIDHYRTLARDTRVVGVDVTEGTSLAVYAEVDARNSGATRTTRDVETTLGGGCFGAALREKVAEVMGRALGGVELAGEAGEVVSVVEYGALQGQSHALIAPVIVKLVPEFCASPFFTVLHQDTQPTFKQYNNIIASSGTSYLHSSFLDDPSLRLRGRVFSSFTTKPFGEQVVPPASVSVGFSILDLHILHSPLLPSASLPSQIDSELHIFLFTRAREFKRSGLLVIAFPMGSGRSSTSSPSSFSAGDFEASRSKSHVDLTSADLSSDGHRRVRADSLQDHYTSPSPSPSRDVWQQVSRTLSTAVQRLVSIGSIKASIAHLLLEIPLWARSSAELGRTLAGEDVMKNWDVVESCGLGDDEGPLRVHHPAYRALMNGTMSRGPYVEHCVQFIKVVYESHLLSVLMNRGGMSRWNAEMTLSALFAILVEKGEEGCLDGLQLDFAVVALRRR